MSLLDVVQHGKVQLHFSRRPVVRLQNLQMRLVEECNLWSAKSTRYCFYRGIREGELIFGEKHHEHWRRVFNHQLGLQ